jgi:hypothetical protein
MYMYKSIRNHSYITFIWTFITQTNFLISKQDLNIDFCFISTCLIFDKKPVIVGIMHAITVRVSEWLKLTPSEKYSVIPRRNKLHSMTWWWYPLDTRQARLSWILIVLTHWSNSQRVDTFVVSLHPDTLSWLWGNPSLFFLLNAVFLKEEHPLWIL